MARPLSAIFDDLIANLIELKAALSPFALIGAAVVSEAKKPARQSVVQRPRHLSRSGASHLRGARRCTSKGSTSSASIVSGRHSGPGQEGRASSGLPQPLLWPRSSPGKSTLTQSPDIPNSSDTP